MTDNIQKTPPMRLVPLMMVPTIPNYEWLLISTLRQWVFYSQPRHTASGQTIAGNGFGGCIVRVGRRVLIDLDKFDLWLNQHRQA